MRRFRIDASQKIQASPVDFGMLRDSRGSNSPDPASIQNEIESHREDLKNYFEAKVYSVLEQINADLRTVTSEFIFDGTTSMSNIERLDAYLRIVGGLSQFESVDDSQVLYGFKYQTYVDSDYVMINPYIPQEINEEFELSYYCTRSGMFIDINDIESIYEDGLHVCFPVADEFISFLSIVLSEYKPWLKQLEVDSVVDTCQQIIYEFAKYLDSQFSAIIEESVRKFTENH